MINCYVNIFLAATIFNICNIQYEYLSNSFSDNNEYKTVKNISCNTSNNMVIPGSLIKLILAGAVMEYSQNRIYKIPNYNKQKIYEFIRSMNINSDNRIANDLFLLQGTKIYGDPAIQEKGVKAMMQFLDSLSLPLNEISLFDGTGLNENNRVTANFMVKYLVAVSKKPWFKEFYESLPRPGLDGTVKNIGYTNEKFRVKSGRLKDVFALAGYGVDVRGRDIAFAYIVNIPNAYKMNLELTGAQVLKYLATEALP